MIITLSLIFPPFFLQNKTKEKVGSHWVSEVIPGLTFLGKFVVSAYWVSFPFVYSVVALLGIVFSCLSGGNRDFLSVRRVPYGLGFYICVYIKIQNPPAWLQLGVGER